MPTSQSDAAIGGRQDVTLLEALRQRIQHRLEAEKERIYQEIRDYPLPIPACDAQFNGLLEERTTVQQELNQVNEIFQKRATPREQIELLDEFMQSSQHLTTEVVTSIRQSLA